MDLPEAIHSVAANHHWLLRDNTANHEFDYFQANIAHVLEIWKFGVRNDFAYFAHNDKSGLDIPTWVYRGSFYYKDLFVKKNLGFQVGVDFTYYPLYRPWDFVPSRQDFSPFAAHALLKSGDYPYIDIYVSFKIRKTRISLKYTNVLYGWNNTFDRFSSVSDIGYFSANGYIFNESIIKLSLDWLLEY